MVREPYPHVILGVSLRLAPREKLEDEGRSGVGEGMPFLRVLLVVYLGDGEEGEDGGVVAEEEGERLGVSVDEAVGGVAVVGDDLLEAAEDEGGESLAGHGAGGKSVVGGDVGVAVPGVLVGEVAGFGEDAGGGGIGEGVEGGFVVGVVVGEGVVDAECVGVVSLGGSVSARGSSDTKTHSMARFGMSPPNQSRSRLW